MAEYPEDHGEKKQKPLPAFDSFVATKFREVGENSDVEQDCYYQSISFMPLYQASSFEELRVRSYTMNMGRRLVMACVPQTETKAPSAGVSLRTCHNLATSYGASIIEFNVGEDKAEVFTIHENLVASRSDFVRKALDRNWKEATERIIKLPHVEPCVFSLYQQYAYTAKIYSCVGSTDIESTKEYERLVKAYILGDKLLDSVFQDCIIDCMIHRLRDTKMFDIRLASVVYNNTLPNSPLRRLWTDIYVFADGPAWINENYVGEDPPPDLLHDVSKRYMNFSGGVRPKEAPYMSDTCVYHEHVLGQCHIKKSAFPRA